MKTKVREDWTKLLVRDQPPQGLTFDEVKAKTGIGLDRLRRLLRDAAKDGSIDVINGKALNIAGSPCRMVYYKFKGKK